MRLIRTTPPDNPKFTMGYFELPLGRRIYTLERPWVPETRLCRTSQRGVADVPCGTKGVSCVPPGIYQLDPHESEDHPKTLALYNPELWVYHVESQVPSWKKGFARTAVLIHPANWPEQLRGCIAPGLIQGNGYVENSRAATQMVYEYLKAGDTLEIVYA